MGVQGQAGPGPGDPADRAEPRATLALVDALRPLDPAKERLLGALSHQLRNPLTSVIGYLELLTDQTLGPITPEQDRVLRTVAHSMARLAAMIDELAPTEPGDRG